MALQRIVFEGGAWDGRQTEIDAKAHSERGRAERWARDEGETHVYEKTERTRQVEVAHDTRRGKRYTTEEAVVYELVERRPTLVAERPKLTGVSEGASAGPAPSEAQQRLEL